MTQRNELFVFACMAGKLSLVKSRIVECDDINYVHPKRGTALFQAAIGGHDDIVDYLIEKGADPNLVCPQWGCNAIDALIKQENYKPNTALKIIKAGGVPINLKLSPGPRIIKKQKTLSWYGLDHSLDMVGAWYDFELKTFIQYTRIQLSEVGIITKLENLGLDYKLTLFNGDEITMDAEEDPGSLSTGGKSLGIIEAEGINLFF